jgi:hypothetical protein
MSEQHHPSALSSRSAARSVVAAASLAVLLLAGLLGMLRTATAAEAPQVETEPVSLSARHIITSVACTTPPTPDGFIASGEWDLAATGVVTTRPMTVLLMHDAENLYIAVDATFDAVYHDSYTDTDGIGILVDGNNDLDLRDSVDFSGGAVAHYLPGEGVAGSATLYRTCPDGGNTFGSGWVAASDAAGHVQYELEIPLSGAGHIGEALGLLVRATDRILAGGGMAISIYPPGGYTPWWFECDAEETCVSSWAEVHLPSPCPDPHEPNDSRQNAIPIQRGTTISSFICDGLDDDYFTFPITDTDGVLTVTLSGAAEGLSPLPANYNFTVYRPDGSPWAGTETPGTAAESYAAPADQVGDWAVRVYPNWIDQYSPSVPYYLRVDVGPSFIQTADLFLFSPTVLTATHQFLWAQLKDNFGAPATGLANVEAKIGSTTYAMYDDGETQSDLAAGDGVYSLWYVPASAGTQSVELYVSDDKLASASYVVPATPAADLLVVTDQQALYEEFGDTGTVDGFYDLMDRIYDYADLSDGIVLDVAWDAAGYTALTYTTSLTERVAMGAAVDQFIHDVGARFAAGEKPNFIAILGDDQVIPFYRLSDPKAKEHDYPATRDNTTHADSFQDIIMSDLPYATWSTGVPGEGQTAPQPDVAAGRILLDTPQALIQAIDGYEQPISVTSASILAYPAYGWEKKTPTAQWWDPDYLAKRSGVTNPNYPVGARKVFDQLSPALGAAISTRYGDPFDNNASVNDWTVSRFTNDLKTLDLVFALSHGSGEAIQTPGFSAASDYVWYDDLAGVTGGGILVNSVCHGGYTVGAEGRTFPDDPVDSDYTGHLALGAITRSLPMLGPTSYAYWAHCHIDYPSLSFQGDYWTERMLAQLAAGLTQESSVGEALKHAVSAYATSAGTLSKEEMVTLYSWILYGLPTQELQHASSTATLQVRRLSPDGADPGSIGGAAGGNTIAVQIDAGAIYSIPLQGDETLFSVFGARLGAEDNAPAVPELFARRLFPAGTAITDVRLTAVTSAVIPGTYRPLTVTAMNSDGGIGARGVAPTGLYPREPFTWTLWEGGDETELIIAAYPLRWDLDLGQVTHLDDFAFQVTYEATADGEPVHIVESALDQAAYDVGDEIQVTINLEAETAADVRLEIALSDLAGHRWSTHEEMASLPGGVSELQVAVPTAGLPSGPQVVEIHLRDPGTGRLIAAAAHDLTLDGLSMLAWLDAGVYDQAQTSAELTARLWDQHGKRVTGAATRCTAELDGSPLSLTFTESVAGAYTTTLPLVDLKLGAHTLRLRCEDDRGLEATTALRFGYGAPTFVYLPVVLRNE